MKIILKTKISSTKLVIASLMMFGLFNFDATAQTNPNAPLDDKAVSALLDNLREGLVNQIEDEAQVAAIIEKGQRIAINIRAL